MRSGRIRRLGLPVDRSPRPPVKAKKVGEPASSARLFPLTLADAAANLGFLDYAIRRNGPWDPSRGQENQGSRGRRFSPRREGDRRQPSKLDSLLY